MVAFDAFQKGNLRGLPCQICILCTFMLCYDGSVIKNGKERVGKQVGKHLVKKRWRERKRTEEKEGALEMIK